MPAKAADHRARKTVERADKEAVVEGTFPSAVQTRFHGKTFGYDPNLAKPRQQARKFRDAVLEKHGRGVVLEPHLHQLGQGVEPRHSVIDLKDRLTSRPENSVALIDQPLRVRRVLHDAVGVHQVERVVGKREMFPVGDAKVARQPLLGEVGPGQIDRPAGQVDAGGDRASLREAGKIDGGAAPHFEDGQTPVIVEVHQPEQVVQLLEVVLVQVVEETARPHRMPGDLEIVDVLLPVGPHFVDGRHADNIARSPSHARMHRDIDQLTARTFDVVVVGGGVCGLTIACDAAQRGLLVALVEQHDFGSGSSFNHLRTIHGGLRYLQSFDLARARESIRERRTMAHIAPTAVRPMPFVLPLTASLLRGKMAMRAGLMLDRLLARDRNRQVRPSLRLPPGRVIGRAEALRQFPILEGVDMTGAAIWHDYVATEADRLTLSWGLAAVTSGAVLANYVEATSIVSEGGRSVGIRAIDHASGRSIDIGARIIVNATGASIDRLLGPARLTTGVRMMKAMNLVTRREPPPEAVGGRAPSGRNLFMVPWRNRALFGTWESSRTCAPDAGAVRASEVADFIQEINHAFPSFQISAADVTLVHRGVVPAIAGADGTAVLDGNEQIHDHAASGAPELMSVAGTKYTTARAVAENITDLLFAKLSRAPVPCRTSTTPLPLADLTGDAQLIEAARREMVVTLEDAVVRRTPLGALGCPTDAALAHAATIVGDALEWNGEKKAREIESVRRFYTNLMPVP
jgi:glycerol-3-phosphate dehydrogenase